jgi:hypothetical protein
MTEAAAAFEDDAERIPDSAILYRRVDWDKIGGRDKYPPGATGTLNGNCFTDYPEWRALEMGLPGPCMSVGVAPILTGHGHGPEKMLEDWEGYGLAWIRAGDLRMLERADKSPCPQGIMLFPTADEPWHGVVFDHAERPRKGAVCKAIARVAGWEIALVNE